MIEVRIYKRHDILNEIIKIVSYANEHKEDIKKEEFRSFLTLYAYLYPPLYKDLDLFTPDGYLVVSHRIAGQPNDIICELIFP